MDKYKLKTHAANSSKKLHIKMETNIFCKEDMEKII